MKSNTVHSPRRSDSRALSLIGVFGLPQIRMLRPARELELGQDASGNAQAKLNKSQFKNVKVTVDNGIATLTGNVSLYEYKKRCSQSRPQGEGRYCGSQRD